MSHEPDVAWSEFRARARALLEEAWLASGEPAPMPAFDDDDHLLEVGAADSFQIIELITGLEAAYGVTFDLGDLDPNRVSSIRGLYDVLQGVPDPRA